ncbi:MAG: glutathione S-transferase family protein [Polyangiales bacterium]
MSKAIFITIPFSHYCEKARWALDRAGVEYEERGYLPGLNRAATVRYGGTTVPMLVHDGLVLKDSTDIVAYADRRASSAARRLVPEDAALRDEALAIEDRLDKRMGVAARAWAYTYVLEDLAILRQLATHGLPTLQRLALGSLAGPLAMVIRKGLRIGPTTREWGKTRVDEDLAFVGSMIADGRRFLVGDQLSVADVALATLSAPALLPDEYPPGLPALDALPSDASAQVRRWRETPAGQFALRIYREHRRAPRGA